jgi:putative oxidoreductase
MSNSIAFEATAVSLGLLVLRVVVGLAMAAHGSQKVFGWFGGYGLEGTGGFFDALGFKPGKAFAFMAGATEILSGMLITLGLLGPVGPALMLSVMIVAALTVHLKNGFFAQANGIEVTVLFGVAAIALAFTGFGAFSIDAATGLNTVFSATEAAIALGLGVIGAVGNLLLRRPQPVTTSAATR